MQENLGRALERFHAALEDFRARVALDPDLEAEVFANTDAWQDLLTYKLVPHLGGEGCLVAALAGGTNTGKSTLFNLLLREDISPIRSTAAATCRPVLAGNKRRYDESLAGKLVPEFSPRPLKDHDAVVDRDAPEDALYVSRHDHLPDSLVLLDTPDVDSIDQQNWAVAEHIRAAGDVLVAVLTSEKYKDDRVVGFFRRAANSGRTILPVMNKANPENDFEVARGQLEAFCHDVGLRDPQCFVVTHDFKLYTTLDPAAIRSIDSDATLMDYLMSLDVAAMKRKVFEETVQHFAQEVNTFLARVKGMAGNLDETAETLEEQVRACAQRYEPTPGKQVGGLLHNFVQAKRSPVEQKIGQASATIARGIGAVSRTLRNALIKKATLEGAPTDGTEDELQRQHRKMLGRLTDDLIAGCIESARKRPEPAAHLVLQRLEAMDTDAISEKIATETLQARGISEAFREHAQKTLESWWNDNTGRRRVIEALDRILMIAPAAIAGVMSVHTAGIGVPEAMIFAGPLMEQFAARVFEYQFGDAMFDFLSPWRKEQQAALDVALRAHLLAPMLSDINEIREAFDGAPMRALELHAAAIATGFQHEGAA